jgi:hypothetical protein
LPLNHKIPANTAIITPMIAQKRLSIYYILLFRQYIIYSLKISPIDTW